MNNLRINALESKIININNKSSFCINCDFTGIIRNPHYEQLGTEPLSPCPRCVSPICKCGGVSPYYYYENEKVLQCPCRETGLKIQRIKNIYSKSGIDKKYQWKFISNYEILSKITEQAKTAAYDIIRNFPDVKKGLFLWGNPGTGKTLLSSIILTELITGHAIEGKFQGHSLTGSNPLLMKTPQAMGKAA